jgi:predicted Zn-dependent protease with MMP-like domain
VKRRRFETLVGEALDELPDLFRRHLDNVAVVVMGWPTDDDIEAAGLDPEEDTLYGLYEGIPLTERSSSYGQILPDRIVIFQGPIEEACSSEDEIRREIQVTVVHEIAHFFGIDEKHLEDLGWS